MHLQPDLDQLHGGANAHGDDPCHDAGQGDVGQGGRGGGVAVALPNEEALRVAEDAEHHRAVDAHAGQREGHALEEASQLPRKGSRA